MNQLVKLREFQKTLANYKMSVASKKTLRETNFVLMVGATSAGRNTIIRELLRTDEYYYIVSDTTREKRTNGLVPEKNGVEYWFRTEDEILTDLKAGEFLEAAIIHNQQVSGISMRELKKARDQEKIAITDIEIVGANNIMAAKPDALAIFVIPPSFEEWLSRLNRRSKFSPEEQRRRFESAPQEFEAALTHPYYHFVINDDLEEAAAHIHQMAKLGMIDQEADSKARKLTEELLAKTQAYLKSL